METKTWFQIAEVPICLRTPGPLEIEPFFLPYLGREAAPAVDCAVVPADRLPPLPAWARSLYDDGMHRVYWTPEGVCQYFYIPYLEAPGPEARPADAFQWLDRTPIVLRFRREAGAYFTTACGCFNALKIERLLIGAGRAILHASYIDWQGRGIAFTAPSGTGKSTQAALWERYAGAQTVNGDRMVFGGRDGTLCGFGLPIAGSSRIFLNRTLPLRAVVLLAQGPENRLRRAENREALAFLLRQVTVNRWDGAFMATAVGLLDELISRVPVYHLSCLPDQGAVELLRDTLEAAAPR